MSTYNPSIRRMPQLNIVFGVDFGTAFTKVIAHAPGYSTERAFVVPLVNGTSEILVDLGRIVGASNIDRFLLPSEMYVDSNGRCSLSASKSEARKYKGIKMRLMECGSISDCPVETAAVSAAFLALVLRRSHKWFVENKLKGFRYDSIRYFWNLGFPAATLKDCRQKELFETVSRAAAWLAFASGGDQIILKEAAQAFASRKNANEWEFGLFPEVVAAITGYVKSSQRDKESKLHLLIDIGGGTMDVGSFKISTQKNGFGDRFPIYTAAVDELGVQEYERAKTDELEDEFERKVDRLIRETLFVLYKEVAPHEPVWKDRMRIIVCGGGKSLPFYRKVREDVEAWAKSYIGEIIDNRKEMFNGFVNIPFRKPEAIIDKIADSDFHRLAPAWGLSFEPYNIGEYVEVPPWSELEKQK